MAQLNSTVVEALLQLTEILDQKLPDVAASWPKSDISLSAKQFDSLVASW